MYTIFVNNEINYLSTGAGFLPSTVLVMLFLDCLVGDFLLFTSIKPPCWENMFFTFSRHLKQQIQVLKGSFFEKQPICGFLLVSHVEWLVSVFSHLPRACKGGYST